MMGKQRQQEQEEMRAQSRENKLAMAGVFKLSKPTLSATLTLRPHLPRQQHQPRTRYPDPETMGGTSLTQVTAGSLVTKSCS